MPARKQKRLILTVALVLVLLFLALAGIYFYLPRYVETRLIPQVAESLGLDARDVKVRRIAFSGTELGPVRLAADGRAALDVETLRLDYSLASLLHRQIRGVTLEGLKINVRIDGQGLTVAGIPLTEQAEPDREQAQAQAPDLKTLLPLTLDRIAVHRAILEVVWPGRQVEIPFDIEADTAALPQGQASASIRLTPRQSELNLKLRLDSTQNLWSLDLQKLSADLGRYADLLALPENVRIKGILQAAGTAQGALTPFKPGPCSFIADLADTEISTPRAAIVNSVVKKVPEPIHLKVQGDGLLNLHWSLGPLAVRSAAQVNIDDLGGDLSIDGGDWQVRATAVTALAPQSFQLSADSSPALKTPLSLAWDLAAGSKKQGGLTFTINTRPRSTEQGMAGSLRLALSKTIWDASLPVVWVRGVQDADGLSVDYRLVLNRNKLSLPDGASASAALAAEGRLSMKEGISNDLLLDLTDGVFAMQERRAVVKDIALDLRATQTPSGEWHFSGRSQLQDARFIDPGLQVIAKQIDASLPFAWPAPARAKQGHLTIGAIQWKNQRMGGIQGSLRQQGRGLVFDGQHRSKLFEDMIVFVKGETEGGKASLDLRLPAYSLKKEVDLGGFAPAAGGYLAQGRLEARADLTYENGRVGGSAALRLNQGRLRHEGQKLTLSGISAAIDLDDLAGLHSNPGQRLRIGKIQLEKIQAEDLSVNFQVLSPERLLIEKAGLNWCRGTIGAQDVALATTADQEIALTLDCRGIDMAMMLEQLGVAEGSGDVAMSGRIPVRWSRGRLSFDKGYLASPPGRTGIIMLRSLKGTQQLLEGLPPDTPQRVQMDIAMEALKDYTYKSVDLKLESQADELVFKLALEGKPNRLLPFAYDKELGQFTRVKGKGQADFTGIGIDLNLRSPFNEILNYKKLLKPN